MTMHARPTKRALRILVVDDDDDMCWCLSDSSKWKDIRGRRSRTRARPSAFWNSSLLTLFSPT